MFLNPINFDIKTLGIHRKDCLLKPQTFHHSLTLKLLQAAFARHIVNYTDAEREMSNVRERTITLKILATAVFEGVLQIGDISLRIVIITTSTTTTSTLRRLWLEISRHFVLMLKLHMNTFIYKYISCMPTKLCESVTKFTYIFLFFFSTWNLNNMEIYFPNC